MLSTQPVTEIPHIAAWRSAYTAFGAKPKKERNSLEPLLRRADAGLPRVNRLTDIYNAISVKHLIPLGGEDLGRYRGLPLLMRASGEDVFETAVRRERVRESLAVGAVVWCDDAGVTCPRWDWIQCARTALSEGATRVLFILEALEPCGDAALEAGADELGSVLSGLAPDVRVSRRVVSSE